MQRSIASFGIKGEKSPLWITAQFAIF